MDAGVKTAPHRGARSEETGLSLSKLWAFVAVALPVVTALEATISTVDLAYQVRAGDIMLRSHQLIRADAFTYTAAGASWLDQQWGAQVLFALVHRLGGWEAQSVARAALVGSIFCLVYLACRAAGAPTRTAAWLTLGSFLVVVQGLGMRPQLLGMTLFALTLWLVAGRRRHPRRLWAAPLVVAAWANLHGSFFLGPLVLGLAWLEDRREREPRATATLAIALVAAAAATVNPFGLRAWSYAFDIASDPTIRRAISEWAPPTVRDWTGLWFFLSAAAVAVFLARRGRPAPWQELLSIGLFFAIGLAAGRGVFWWALAAPVIVAADLGRDPVPERPGREGRPSWVNAVIAVLLVALGISFLPGARDRNPLIRTDTLLSDAPAGITAELERSLDPGDRIFAAQRFGSWFEYALPENPVFVDSRIEVFPSSVWRQYRAVSLGQEGWQEVLDRWDVAAVVVHPEQQSELLPRIQEEPGWRLAYEDAEGKVFIRA